jgi:hypothetical protein
VERGCEVVSPPHDGDRHACGLQAEEGRLRPRRAARERLRRDMDERGPSARERALEQPVDETPFDP